MPEPFSSNSGLGMKVAALPWRRATFFTTYLNVTALSAACVSGAKRMPISFWPEAATSWW